MAITNATTLADYAAGISTQNATLKVDSGNKRVGIGTTNPKQTLQVGTAVSVYGNSGIVSATSFYGDGTNITGVANTDVINTENINVIGVATVGSAVTINSTGIDAVSGVITASSFVGNVTGTASNATQAEALTGTPDITVRNITGVAATFTGVLTYEDVTNVDSVGIVTARGGLEVGAAGVGGTISSGGNVIFAGITTVGTALSLADNVHARFGNAGDLKIYHDSGGQSRIEESGSSVLKIKGSDLRLSNTSNSADYLQANDGAAVNLYFNGSKKFETHNTGIRVTGIATVTSTIYVNTNGSSFAENNLNFRSSGKAYIDHGTTSQDIDFRVSHGSALDRTAITIGSAGITTFYDTPHDDLGNLRDIPLRSVTGSAATLVVGDAGKVVSTNTTGWTVPASTFSEGDTVTLLNNSAGGLVITCSAVTTYLTSDGTTVTSSTLGARGMATLYFVSASVAYLQGTALS